MMLRRLDELQPVPQIQEHGDELAFAELDRPAPYQWPAWAHALLARLQGVA
jgi:hypothetical protein